MELLAWPGLELAKLKDNIYATLEIWHLRVREATSSLRLPPNPEQATMMMPMMMGMMRGDGGFLDKCLR